MRTGGPQEVHDILRQLEQSISAVVERQQADQQLTGSNGTRLFTSTQMRVQKVNVVSR